MRRLLSDIVVVELSDDPSGAYCGKAFADLGAEVVKVEGPGGARLRTRPGAFVHLNTNKRSAILDPGVTGASERLWSLLERADLVVETLGDGDLGAFGISWEDASARRPSLSAVTLSGFGATGPYAGYKWSDLVVQTVAWSTLPAGQPEEPVVPVRLPGIVALCSFGHTAALGGLAAVVRAQASGAGARVDCAAYEALGTVPSRAGRYLGWEYLGREPLPPAPSNTADTLIPIGVFPCGDGYVSMMSTPQQLPEMLQVLDDDALTEAFSHPDAFIRPETKEILDAALYPWLLSHTREELTAAAQAAGWPFAGVNAPPEVLEIDHLHQRGFWAHVEDPTVGPVLLPGPPYRHDEGGWLLRRRAPLLGEDDHVLTDGAGVARDDPPTRRADPAAPPLQGVRVLDLTTVWSGPYLTQLLADLGAEVIRLENPSVFPPTTKGYLPRPPESMMLGSLLAMYAPPVEGAEDRPYNRHSMNNSIARNKLSCTLDPRRPEGYDVLMRLIDRSDVIVENLKVSTLHQMGIHESQIRDRNPRMIVLRVPPAGLSGDWSNYTGFGAQFDGLAGLVSLIGHHDSEIIEAPSTTYMDAATGPAGAFAVVAALHYRDVTGRGQLIELAQMENVLNQLGDVFVDTQLGHEPERTGNRDPQFAPQGVYPCRGDRTWLALTVAGDDEWAALAALMGRAELAGDPRFADTASRYAHHDELDELIGAWTAEQDVLEAFHALQAAGIAAGPQLDEAMLDADPHVRERGWIRPLTSRDVGSHPHIGHAFQGVPQVWWRGSPVLGEDNDYVYREVIGVDDEEYERLVAAKVIVDDYLDADGNPY